MQSNFVVISSPSGGGKTTVINELLQRLSFLAEPISATTRKPREGEKQGVDYYFLSQEEFQQKITQEEFLEYEEVYPNMWYGTLYSELEKIETQRKGAIFDLDVKGALNLKQKFGDSALLIFLDPPSKEELIHRLKKRDTISSESFQDRIDRIDYEISQKNRFDMILVNDELTILLERLESIVRTFFDVNN